MFRSVQLAQDYVSAQMAAELILSGCTMASDHLYLFPHDCMLDDEIQALQDIGMRFHASRGSMSVGESQGGCRRMGWWKRRRRSSSPLSPIHSLLLGLHLYADPLFHPTSEANESISIGRVAGGSGNIPQIYHDRAVVL